MSYGYYWWLLANIKQNPVFEDAYSATGFGGQFITVFPKSKIVVAHKYKIPLLAYVGLHKGSDVPSDRYWALLHDFIGQIQ